MSSGLNGIGLSHVSEVSWTRRCLASALAVASVLGWSASAQAGVYNVYTNSQSGNGAMTKNANDGFCSLAEAVDSVNAGSPQWNCVDAFPGSGAIIQLWEASGRPFAQNHFRITSLTITRDVMLSGSGAYIDSTGTSGLVIDTNASVEVNGLTLTYTGTNGGRLIRNQGELAIFDSVLQNGNVSALSGTSGYGGAIYNTGVISYLGFDVYLQNNRARRGGAIYNSTATIGDLRATIIGNTATLAGGGIYNQSTSGDGNGAPNGRITANGASIVGNSAKSGGGVFNRGQFYISGTYITLNSVSGTGSGETTPAGQSLDGAGGGIVSTPFSSTLAAVFNTIDNSSISSNTATGYGGGVYNAGQANLVGVTIHDNRALSGAAVFAVLQGAFYYCQIGSSGHPASLSYNTLHATGTGRYSILDGILLASNDELRKCTIVNTTATGNSAPRYCRSNMVRTSDGVSVCPQ